MRREALLRLQINIGSILADLVGSARFRLVYFLVLEFGTLVLATPIASMEVVFQLQLVLILTWVLRGGLTCTTFESTACVLHFSQAFASIHTHIHN